MKRVTEVIVRYRYTVLVVAAVMVVLSLMLATTVEINYDLAAYLPEGSMTKQAIAVLEDEFGYPGMADVMVEGLSISETLELKKKLMVIPGVKSVLWLDDVADVTLPESMIPRSIMDGFYKDGAALLKIQFAENDYSLSTGTAIEAIRTLVGDDASITGTAEDSRQMRAALRSEILLVILVVVPLCVAILMIASSTWIEPILYLVVIGVSVAINMGTNTFFGQISFITHAMAGVLQLAISMDYSLFLFHRYVEERDAGADVMDALQRAAAASLSSIAASALTTIAGFLALVFMQYRIGADIGLVLAKGIVLSFASVIFLMPALIFTLQKPIEQTRHRSFLPSFARMGEQVIRWRHAFVPLIIVLVIPAYLAQGSNSFLYGDTSGSSEQGAAYRQRVKIQERFGIYNPIMLLVPNDSVSTEIALVNDLRQQPHVKDVQALVSIADPKLPREIIPAAVREQFVSSRYSRMIILLDVDGEKPESFEAVAGIRQTAEHRYPGSWLTAGKATSIADIRDSVEADSQLVMLFSILSVGAIVLLTFRSLSIPILLVSVIQASVWLNMSFPYLSGSSLVYIGYLVVSSLQLGATIDYGILLSNRYMENRITSSPMRSAVLAIQTAGVSVTVSGLILAVAGYGFGMVSRISAVSEIGILLGRGAVISAVMVLFVLPALLVFCDRLILRTTHRVNATLAD